MKRILQCFLFCLVVSPSLSAQTARDYYNELKATNIFNRYTDEYVCFYDNDEPSFMVIAKASDVIDEMKKTGDLAGAKEVSKENSSLFVQGYHKGVARQENIYDAEGTEGTDYSLEFKSPFHGKMRYSFNWATGRFILQVFALDKSKIVPAGENSGKCELIHPWIHPERQPKR